LNDNEVKSIMEKIEQYNKDQELLEDYQIEKESLGWDLKFQNYWGYIIAADRNFEQTLSMCEKLFKHVGEFREHAAAQVKKIVDSMHDPIKNPATTDKSLIPLAPEGISEEHKVFMDEDDSSLYFSGPGYQFNLDKQGSVAGGQSGINQTDLNTSSISTPSQHSVYVSSNILYKLTNPADYVFTFSNEGAAGSVRDGQSNLPGNN